MTEEMRRLCKYRFLAIVRINALLRNARRLIKAGQPKRAKVFIGEAKETIEAFVGELYEYR